MRLSQALRLDRSTRLAFVGAGGKSSALFRSGRDLLADLTKRQESPARVLLAATTHLSLDQTTLADRHFILEAERASRLETMELPEGLCLFTGAPTTDNRTTGLSPEWMDWVLSQADRLDAPLLIEADGSKQCPLKAPASHEPVIPVWMSEVVVTAGLSGVGKPLEAEWVHRPERFALLGGIAIGQPVSLEALERVLCHPQGGLKGIPPRARRIVLLNQADDAERKAIANRMVPHLLEVYQAVVIASLEPTGLTKSETEAIRPGSGQVWAVHEPIAGIVLAAGGASRMGQTKQMLEWRGRPLVWHVAQAGLRAGLSPLIVVTGYRAEELRQALADLPVVYAHNEHWQAGQSTSVRAGVMSLPAHSGGVVFLLADQPLVSAELVRSLVEKHVESLAPIVAPLVGGQRANPVLFDQVTFPELCALQGDVGGRTLFSRYPVTWLPWNEPAVLIDIDTPQDYQRLLDAEEAD